MAEADGGGDKIGYGVLVAEADGAPGPLWGGADGFWEATRELIS